MKLTPKLILSFLLIGLIPMLLLAGVSIWKAEQGLNTLASQQLESARELKASAVKRYFDTIERETITLADTQVILQAMFYMPPQVQSYAKQVQLTPSQQTSTQQALLKLAKQQLSLNDTQAQQYLASLDKTATLMQKDYLLDNTETDRSLLLKAKSAAAYHAIHASMQPVVRKFITNAHFKELYLIDIQSERILYSVNKSIDLGLKLTSPLIQNTGIYQAYQRSKDLQAGQTVLVDYATYSPAGAAPVATVSVPVVFEGKTLGLLMVQLSNQELNQIMTDRLGMGMTGETFLVGADGLIRSDINKDKAFNVIDAFNQNLKHPHPAIQKALNGTTGVGEFTSFANTSVLSAYAPLSIKELDWALVAEMNTNEALASAYELEITALIIAIIAILAVVVIAIQIARSISRPILGLVATIHSIKRSADFSLRHPIDSKDETAQAGQALNDLMDGLQQAFGQIQSVMNAIAHGDFQQRVEANFEGDLQQLKTAVNSSANSVSNTMMALSDIMQAIAEGHFASRMNKSVEGQLRAQVDSAMEQMNIALNNISHAMDSAAHGVFTKRVDGDLKGDMLTLQSSVNASLSEIQTAIDDITEVAIAMSTGDLTHTIHGQHDGELDELQSALNLSITNLAAMVSDVRSAAVEVSQGANEISGSSSVLNERTQSQAASLEETAASMEQMTSTVKNNSASAERAHSLANAAENKAKQGVAVMTQTMLAISQIEEASSEIGDITVLIDSIAFQTNLLALNAAVEAARAGEAGRGFAVVAGEVRNLAGRSADAANQIKRLIDNTVVQIQEGNRLAQASNDSLLDIQQAIEEVNAIVKQITQASHEQAIGISQVNQAISEMDQNTQQNAHLVESLSTQADHVNQLAERLNEVMAAFQLKG